MYRRLCLSVLSVVMNSKDREMYSHANLVVGQANLNPAEIILKRRYKQINMGTYVDVGEPKRRPGCEGWKWWEYKSRRKDSAGEFWNDLGERGWELVAVSKEYDFQDNEIIMGYFKREKISIKKRKPFDIEDIID